MSALRTVAMTPATGASAPGSPLPRSTHMSVHVFKPKNAAKRLCIAAASRDVSSHPSPLDVGRQLAELRAREAAGSAAPLLADPYAALLADGLAGAGAELATDVDPADEAFDLLSTRFIDDQLLLVSSSVNVGRSQEYNQVVLVGDGCCTRSFRMPWPQGTVIYMVAPGEVHERAEAVLAAATPRPRVPRGCLLRRVVCDYTIPGATCARELQRAGYRPDRVSVWALQGTRRAGLATPALEAIFADASNLAALESVLVGELGNTIPHDVDQLLASFGLLGTTFEAAAVAEQVGAYGDVAARSGGADAPRPLLFRAQQRRLSLAEIEMYDSHVTAAEEVDEDFFGTFS
jgi:hypothetical protein